MLSKDKFLEYMNEFKELRDLVDDLNTIELVDYDLFNLDDASHRYSEES